MLPKRSGILVEAINTMENVQWVAYEPSEIFSGAIDAVFIRKVVISRHTKVRNLDGLQPALNMTFYYTTRPPHYN